MSAAPYLSDPQGTAPDVSAAPFTFAAAQAPRWFGVLMIVLFALLMPIGYLGDEGEALVTAVGGIAALSFVLQKRPPSLGVLILTALVVWAVVSFAWSPLEPRQLHPHSYNQIQALTAPKLLLQLVIDCAFVSGALKLAADQRDKALKWLGWTLAAVVVLLAFDAVVDGQVFGTLSAMVGSHLRPDIAKSFAARGCYAVALFFWPVALSTWRRVPVAIPGVAGFLIAVSSVRLGVDAPAAAMVLSLLVFLAARVSWRAAAWACLVGVVVYFLAAPLVFQPHGAVATTMLPGDVGKMSWHFRLDIWRFASGLIERRPLIGYGLDASRAYEPRIPMHPHDAALQLWLETGAIGAVLGALFFVWLFYKVLRLGVVDPAWAATACATAAVYLLIGAISFGVWQEWWISLGAAAIAACAMLLQARRQGLAAGETEAAPGALQAL